jgi:SAM-dependent methyltransferase
MKSNTIGFQLYPNDKFHQRIKNFLRLIILRKGPASKARIDSNRWIYKHAKNIKGLVLSVGSGDDSDGMGNRYRDYFESSSNYTTSENDNSYDVDLILDVRNMNNIMDDSYDSIFCSGVLEHVDDFPQAMNEITRVLKSKGILLLGLPFNQKPHMEPFDFWRFTRYGIQYMLNSDYHEIYIDEIDLKDSNYPSSYWTKAIKK